MELCIRRSCCSSHALSLWLEKMLGRKGSTGFVFLRHPPNASIHHVSSCYFYPRSLIQAHSSQARPPRYAPYTNLLPSLVPLPSLCPAPPVIAQLLPSSIPSSLLWFCVGEAAVGKSSLVLRFVSNDFTENKEPTIGAGASSSSLPLPPFPPSRPSPAKLTSGWIVSM
jgi:hypothetical protein